VSVSNLGVVKNPHFAGSLRYDSPFEPASGKFFVHLLAGQRPLRLLQALIGLARGRFAGRFGSRSWQATRLGIDAPAPFPIEVDGEVVLARRACFALRPGGLRVCP
jgi:diacylglycerol kinase family enzyme